MSGTPALGAVNALPPDVFALALSPLFEGAPAFLHRLARERPFSTWHGLFDAARRIAHDMPEAEQIELVDAHPRLGAPPGSVSALSFREQGYDRESSASGGDHASADTAPGDAAADGVDDATADDATADDATAADASAAPDTVELERRRVAADLDDLNARYEARFGFRYCVFVAGRPRAALIPEMAAALGRERGSELHRALDAVVDIAIDRWSATARPEDRGEASA